MRTVLVCLLLALTVSSFASAGIVDAGEPFVLSIGESVAVGDPPLILTLESVPADSRCPRNVVCVWEGEVTARVTLEAPPEDAVSADLHSPGSPFGPSEIVIAPYLVELIEVQPYPAEPVPIEPEEYRVAFVVSSVAEELATVPANWSTLKGIYR